MAKRMRPRDTGRVAAIQLQLQRTRHEHVGFYAAGREASCQSPSMSVFCHRVRRAFLADHS